MIKKSPYQILELEGDFEYSDIKKAYRKAIKEYPPEQNPQQFRLISDAYSSLTNEEYFLKSLDDSKFIFDVCIELEKKPKVDNSKYLKNVFEVPFKI